MRKQGAGGCFALIKYGMDWGRKVGYTVVAVTLEVLVDVPREKRGY